MTTMTTTTTIPTISATANPPGPTMDRLFAVFCDAVVPVLIAIVVAMAIYDRFVHVCPDCP
jgi:hypothetical protein